MRTLVVIESDGAAPKPGSLAAIGFAEQIASHDDGDFACLVLGSQVSDLASAVARYGKTYIADDERLANPLADRYAAVIVKIVESESVDLVAAASTTFAKDIVGRAAGLLGGAMASDVIAHAWRGDQLVFERPIFADGLVATVTLHGREIVTIRPTADCASSPR